MPCLRRRWALGLFCALPLAALSGCGDDEPSGGSSSGGTGGTGATGGSGGTGATGGSAGVAGTDGGVDQGPFGDRVPITETSSLQGLTAAVNAVRDKYGMVHVYARTFEDALRVEGYMMAVDRAGQLEIARRLATGRLAELFAGAEPAQIDDDITMRTIGLHRVAQQIYDGLDPASQERRAIDAFADGVTQWFRAYREGKVQIAQDLPGMPPEVFTDWSPVDSLAMARLQTWSLSYDADTDISWTDRVAKVRAVFNTSSVDPAVLKREKILVDTFRFDPLVAVTPQTGFPDDPPLPDVWRAPGAPQLGTSGPGLVAASQTKLKGGVQVAPGALAAAQPFLRSVARIRDFLGGDEFFGSNNWAVAGSKTATGNAMVANDPHLGLTSPMVFWPTHLVVDNPDPTLALELIGIAFPGIPGVVLGSNRTLAWGATTSAYDVTDVWKETLSTDATGVTFKGQKVAFQKISETLKIAGKPDYTWDVLVVPHHGPVVPTIDSNHQVVAPKTGDTVLSAHWTGHQPSGEYAAVFNLARAKNVDEARAAMQPFQTGGQNWMLADSNGDVFVYSKANLPYRDKKAYTWDPATFTGTLPGFVLDGEKGEHEWTGQYLEEQYIPKLKSPAKGWIATANTDQIGSTLDNDPSNELLPNNQPFYIGSDFSLGFRLGRIHQRLEAAAGSMTLDEMASIQGDHTSALGSRLAKYLVTALEQAEAEKATPGTHPDLATVVADARYAPADAAAVIAALKQWETAGAYVASSGIDPDDGSLNVDAQEAANAQATVVFNAWVVRAMARALEDEMKAAGLGDLGSDNLARAFVRMLEQPPASLATYDAASGQSALWDDMTTTGITESMNDRLVTALLDAVDDLNKLFGTDRTKWRWGDLHRVTFKSLNPLWFVNIPQTTDPIFKLGFPRPGDQWGVDAANFGIARGLASPLSFTYGSGPVQRFVAEVTKTGPKIKNALPGGAVLARDSKYFDNEAEYWFKNQNHDVPFEIDDVEAAVEPGGQHVLFTP